MVGVEGGLMAIIHLVLKRPILGVLGVVGVLAVEFGGYPVGNAVTESVRSAGCAIEDAKTESITFLNGQAGLVEERYRVIAGATEMFRDMGYVFEDARKDMSAFLNGQSVRAEARYRPFGNAMTTRTRGMIRSVTDTPSIARSFIIKPNPIQVSARERSPVMTVSPSTGKQSEERSLPAGFR